LVPLFFHTLTVEPKGIFRRIVSLVDGPSRKFKTAVVLKSASFM
jgi:hypothetical protein